MVKATTKIDKKLQNDLSRKYLIAAAICIAVGLCGVLIYALREFIFPTPAKWQSIFIIFALPLGFGLLIDFLVFKTKRTTIVEERVVDYTFSDGGIDVVTNKTSAVTNAHIDYANVLKTKQTKHFYFIYLSGDVTYPVDVRGLTDAELAEVKGYLKIEEKEKK